MKRDYAIIKEFLNQSGFRWNPVTRMVERTDDVWDTYVKVLSFGLLTNQLKHAILNSIYIYILLHAIEK